MKKRNGFSLIEILVVTTIIVLLTATAIVTYSTFLKQSRDAKRKADLSQLSVALEMYRSNNDAYPISGGTWLGTCSGFGSRSDTGAGGYIPNLAPTYIQKLPRDPKESQSFSPCLSASNTCYIYASDGKDYKLLAHCGAEITPLSSDPFYDIRSTDFQISSSSNSLNW